MVVPPFASPDGAGLPAWVPRLLTPFEVSGSPAPELEEDELEPEPLPVPRPLESLDEPRVEEPLPLPVAPDEVPDPDELPMPDEPPDEPEDEPLIPPAELAPPEELATSTPRALAVLLSSLPVACRLLDF